MRGEVRHVEKKNWAEKKKEVRQLWRGEVSLAIRFKHSKFAHKYFRHNEKNLFSPLASCCGFRPWCQQDRTMGRFEFQSMTIFRIGIASQYSKVLFFSRPKSLIEALQLTSICKYFCCINLLNQMWFRALMSARPHYGEV